MAWTQLKTAINNAIKANNNQEITGQVLNNMLNTIVNSLGKYATFAGVATPSTNPGVFEGPILYFSRTAGTYPNFDNITVYSNELVMLYNINGNWDKALIGEVFTEATTDKIANGAVTTEKIANGSVTTIKIADDSVTTIKLVDGSVTTIKLADGAITENKIADGAITSSKIGLGTIKNANIADAAITSAKIDDGAITSAKIANGAINTVDIADKAITAEKLGTEAIGPDNIATHSVTTSKLADKSVTTDKLADSAMSQAMVEAISAETEARENADITLRTMIQTEVSNRQIAVKQEEIRAMAAEKANTQAIEDEAARATTEDERLQGEIDNANDKLNSLEDKVNSNHDHFYDEVARLDLTDNEIKAGLEAETARAQAAEEANAQAIAEEKAAIMGTDRIADGAVTLDKIAHESVDDEPIAGSDNLVKSGGVANKLAELNTKVFCDELTATNNVENTWSAAFPMPLFAGQKYEISTNAPTSPAANAVIAFTNNGDSHITADEIVRFSYNSVGTPIIVYEPTEDSKYMWVYAGSGFSTGVVITIHNTSSIQQQIEDNKVIAKGDSDVASEKSDFAKLGVGALAHNNPLKGNCPFAVIGDSISTFNKAGYFYPTYEQFFPQESMGITDIKQQYWFKLYNRQGGNQLVNASYSGSCVTNINSYPTLYARTSVVGTPDICVVALGSNDSNGQVALGDYDFSSSISSLSESQFIPAYIKGIKNLLAINPKMQIVCIAFKMNQAYKDAIKTIAEYFGQFFIDCSTYSTNDGLHPNADGMEQIYDKINAFLVGEKKNAEYDTLKSITTERIPWQFLHNTSKVSQIHFCLGGDEYILAQNTWINEARMGGYAWWMTNGKVGKHIPFNIGADKFKVVVPAWAEMSDDFPASLIVAGQQMYQQYWKIGLINPETGELATSYSLPFDPRMNFVGNVVDGYNHFSVGIKAGRTYKITNNTNDNQIIKISTSLDISDTFVVSDTDGNLCKKTLVNMGDTFEFTPASNATYIHIYQGKNQGSTECKILFEAVSLVTSSDAVTALCVYDMKDASDVRLFVSSDTEKKIYNIKALDGSDARTYNYLSGVNNISAMCLDEFGKLYVAANDTSLAPYDGNTIYVLDPIRNGALIGTFVIPRKADGGMEIKDGVLYTLDNRTATINKISLGGTCFSINNMPTPYHLPLSYSFEKRGVAISGGAGEANVIYDEEMGLFRMWYSRGSIAYCESYNGINWTTPENVIPNASRSHVFKHNGIWHIFYVRTDSTSSKYKEVYHRTSQDGIIWGDPTLVLTSEQVAAACANSVWSDFQQFGSVYVTIENGTWKMMMEGRTESDYTWSIGYAESTDGTTWVVDGNSPTTINHPSFNTGKGQKMIGRIKVFYCAPNGVYWMVCHYSQYLDIPTRIGLAWSTDLKHINVLPSSPLLDFTEVEECDQLADAWMMEHNGTLFLYNSCVRNYSPEHSYIRVATLNMSAKEFVESVSIVN